MQQTLPKTAIPDNMPPERIPDFRVRAGEPPQYTPGMVNCISRLVLEWDVREPQA